MSIGYDPIGSSPIGAEAPVTTASYGFVEIAALALTASEAVSQIVVVNSVTDLELTAEFTSTTVYNTETTTALLLSDSATYVVSYTYTNSTDLQVAVQANTSTTITSTETSYSDLDCIDNVSISFNFYPVGGNVWEGYSYTKGYTLFEQIYENDTYPLVITAVSSEQFVSAAVSARPTQIWIG
jgi:hypothetical protein